MTRCPFCGRRTEPWEVGPRRCRCGAWLLGGGPPGVMPAGALARWAEGRRLRRLQRAADRLCALILRRDVPEADIRIERARLRAVCERLFPDKLDLFEMIFERRFDRLWAQFRAPLEEAP